MIKMNTNTTTILVFCIKTKQRINAFKTCHFSSHIPQKLLKNILTIVRVHGNTARGDPETNFQELQKTGEHAELHHDM